MKHYELKTCEENLAGITLKLETLADLDRTIDSLCEGADEKDAEAVFLQERCPYFGVVWPAARALAEHIARMGTWLNGKTVLEVGCGLAVPSLVAARLGATVVATDFHPDVKPFLDRNLGLNQLSIDYHELDWRQAHPELGTFDFVIGSDVLYEMSHPADVARTLVSHCKRESHIILTDPGRPYLQTCADSIRAAGFRSDMFVRTVADPRSDRAGDKATKEVFVLAFQKLV